MTGCFFYIILSAHYIQYGADIVKILGYGITINPKKRSKQYSDHTGVEQEFSYVLFASINENKALESIVKQRAIAPMNSTTQLAAMVKEAIPAATRRTGGNPAKRTFQALRIETNDELGTITRALPAALELLNVGARLVVMSFQSLEDRIVKQLFVASTTSGTPRNLPFELPEYAAKFSMITRGSETPTESELEENSRSQSVRLRAIERVAA
jgi:16S rRNA (cytosine1402-N4)-methyltransferase